MPLPVLPERLAQGPFENLAGSGQRQRVFADVDAARAFVAGDQGAAVRDHLLGAYCLVGTRVIVLGGAALPDRSLLGAGSVLNKAHSEEYAVYAGQPAEKVKALDPEGAYFHRASGFVH